MQPETYQVVRRCAIAEELPLEPEEAVQKRVVLLRRPRDQAGRAAFDESRDKVFYAVALGLFVLGLLSKTVTATLPAALLVIFWWQRGTLSWRRDILPLAPFFLLGAAFGALTSYVEGLLIGEDGAPLALSLLDRALLAGQNIWFYLFKLVWPFHLIFIYPRWNIDSSQWWQWLFPLATLAALVVLWSLRGCSRAPLAATLYFVGTLFPALGFVNVYPFRYSFVADHFQYLACLSVITLAVGGIAAWLHRLPAEARIAGYAVGAVAVVGLAILSGLQSCMYSGAETLYRATLEQNPDCWMASNNLGLILLHQGSLTDATQQFRQAVERNPDAREAHSNLGLALRRAGQTDDAIGQFRIALSYNPGSAMAHHNLGAALLGAGRPEEAIPELREAVRLDPTLYVAHSDLGAALFATGHPQEGLPHFEETVQLRPDFPRGQYHLAMGLLTVGRTADAISHLELALRQTPNDADCHTKLGGALLLLSRPTEAVEHFEQVAQLNPTAIDAWSNLATAQSAAANKPAAISAARQAIELARAQHQVLLAEQLEAWLASLVDGPSSAPALPSPALPPQSP